jgi:hypothetical protein
MKKNNIKQLKEIVSNEIFFDLSYQGVQAYNISANEYEVITGFWKCNGRYYFVDRNNNKYLAGRYARIAWRWLNTRHLFGDDSEAVTLTGWQYLGVAAVAIVCGLLFSIKF